MPALSLHSPTVEVAFVGCVLHDIGGISLLCNVFGFSMFDRGILERLGISASPFLAAIFRRHLRHMACHYDISNKEARDNEEACDNKEARDQKPTVMARRRLRPSEPHLAAFIPSNLGNPYRLTHLNNEGRSFVPRGHHTKKRPQRNSS
jgi:hypothetical protein